MKPVLALVLVAIAGCGVPNVSISCGSATLPQVRVRGSETSPSPTTARVESTPAPTTTPAPPQHADLDVTAAAPATAPAARPRFPPPEGAARPRDPQAIAFSLHRVDLAPVVRLPEQPPPAGVSVARRRSGTVEGPVFEIDRVPDETLAQTLSRVRPWFESIELAADRRFVFGLVRPPTELARLEIEVVERSGIAVYGADLEWVAVTPGIAGGVELGISEAGRARLPVATAPVVGADFAIVVADRLLWAPKFGGVFGDRDREPLGFQRDATFAAALRDAIAGDAEAIRALHDDRLTDGGTPADLDAAREAALPPAPVLGADGRTTVSFEPHPGRPSTASLVVPAGFELQSRSAFGPRWRAASPAALLDLHSLGCSPCSDDDVARHVDEACAEVLHPRARAGTTEAVETILDGHDQGLRTCGTTRATTAVAGGEELVLQCYRLAPGQERAVGASMHLWTTARADALEQFATLCANLRAESLTSAR